MNRIRFIHWTRMSVLLGLLAFGPALRAQIPDMPLGVPLVRLLATDPAALEGTSSGAFTLIRVGPATNDLTVSLSISGTASNGVDFATIGDTAVIPTGAQAMDLTVTPIVDPTRRGNKTVVLTVVTNANYAVAGGGRASVLIVDDVFDLPPPSVTLTSPTNGSGFDDPKSVTIQAEANDPGAPITGVSFFANDRFLGKSATAPYSVVWTNPPGGTFTLFARAQDQLGRSALSAPVQITVTDAVPVVTITAPTNGQHFAAHSDVKIKADASDTDDSIVSVAFYANGHPLGTATNSPYSITWSNAPTGRFLLRAVATDQSGDRGYSRSVLINVGSVSWGMEGVSGN